MIGPEFVDAIARKGIFSLVMIVIGAIVLWEIGKYFWQHLSVSWSWQWPVAPIAPCVP